MEEILHHQGCTNLNWFINSMLHVVAECSWDISLKIDFTISRGDVSKDPRPIYGSNNIEKNSWSLGLKPNLRLKFFELWKILVFLMVVNFWLMYQLVFLVCLLMYGIFLLAAIFQHKKHWNKLGNLHFICVLEAALKTQTIKHMSLSNWHWCIVGCLGLVLGAQKDWILWTKNRCYWREKSPR